MYKYMYIWTKLTDTKENGRRMEWPTNFKQVKILTEKNSQSRMCQVYSTTTDGNLTDLTTRHGRRTNIPFFFFLTKKLNYLFLLSALLYPSPHPSLRRRRKAEGEEKRLDRFRNWNIEFRKIEIFKRNNHKGRAVRPGNVEILRWLFPGKESE